ncbi:MAG: glycosyltransferase family 39 protein [Polyangiaceae bacterium]
MAADRHWGTWGVPVGALFALVASAGILDIFEGWDQRDTPLVQGVSVGELASKLIELAASSIVLAALLKLAVSGALMFTPNSPRQQIVIAGCSITLAFLWVVVCVFRVGKGIGVWRRDELGEERGLLRRHGFWLVVITTLVYLPMLGSFSLTDPWETHYGEVTREMLAKDDWISLWWAQDGWFWSKPILDFWMQGLSFATFGVQYQPDQMLAGVASGRFPQPEWAARFPVFLMSLGSTYVLYRGMVRAAGRRAAFLGAVILITMPYWFLLSHQTMTDMPYVAPLAAAGGFFLLGFLTDPDQEIRRYEIRFGGRTLSLSAWHFLFGLIALLVVPQALYLISRNVSLLLSGPNLGFQWHLDQFTSGSGGGNCGLPGNQPCRTGGPVYGALWLQPSVLGLLWAAVLFLLLLLNRHERRLSRLYFLAAWLMTALSTMGKGAPGLVLPLVIALAYVGVTRRWNWLLKMELPALVLLVCCVALPWYVQMYLRHGSPFTDRLIFHDMFKRAFVHVHDTNTGDDVTFRYYVWQLGYGLFPWSGLSAAGLLWWARRPERDPTRRNDALLLLAMWFVGSFGMFSITLTKFHHYILPAVPPIAMCAGVVLDRMLGRPELPAGSAAKSPIKARAALPYALTIGAAALLLCYSATLLFPGGILGTQPGGSPPPASRAAAGVTFVAALIGFGLAIRVFGAPRPRLVPGSRPAFSSALLGAIAICSALVIAIVGVDFVASNPGDIDGQARLMHLFTYNYKRPWPKTLDFTGALSGFTLAAALACGLMFWRWLRPHAAALLVGVSVWWAAWGVNAYFVELGPHWGQRETLLEYYRQRSGPDEPVVAYQMNWKGENFYTGNRIPAFVATGQKFKEWIAEQRKAGVKTIYFVTEHGRISSLKRELDNPAHLEVLTDEALNNKFMLARVIFDDAHK